MLEMYENTVILLTLHPVLHGLLLLTASYYLPKSHRLLSNCKKREAETDGPVKILSGAQSLLQS